MTSAPFHGAKIALLCGGRILAYQRDDKPGIPNPGLWDLPGGGREGDETPIATALRETQEEFGLPLPPGRVVWQRRYASVDWPGHMGWFLVGTITPAEIAAIRFGEEGQC
ncbi:MAG: NUDIX hydrolase [Sphingomonadaceae bacterium]|nr:NUDIX hydrolase [Sphingomonadaceae bacterium]